jgi:hypothetical protein
MEVWILLYFEDSVWNAHALDLDLVRSADTPTDAFGELKEAILTQLAFARQKGAELVHRMAPDHYFPRWKHAKDERIVSDAALRSGLDPTRDYAMVVQLSAREIEEAVKERSFERVPHV